MSSPHRQGQYLLRRSAERIIDLKGEIRGAGGEGRAGDTPGGEIEREPGWQRAGQQWPGVGFLPSNSGESAGVSSSSPAQG